MANTDLLKQADLVLTKCGRPIIPRGHVPIPKKFYYTKFFQLPDSAPPYPPDTNEAVENSSGYTFLLRALSGIAFTNATSSLIGLMYFQIQYPDGTYFQNQLSDLVTSCGFGSGRLPFAQPIEVPPGSKLFVTLDASISANTWSGDAPPGGGFSVSLFFEGVCLFPLAGAGNSPGVRSPQDSAASLDRFFASPNQNILTAEPMGAGLDGVQCHPETPAGFLDDPFIYSNSAVPAVFSEAQPVATTIKVQIESTSDFLCQRIMFGLVVGDVAPTFFGRLRTSLGGSAICNDYVPLNNMRLIKDWSLKAGLQAYVDVYAITNGGNSTTTLYVYLEGCKRRRGA